MLPNHHGPALLILLKRTINFRLAVVCMAAAAVGLSMVLISISKLLLVICSLGVLLFARRAQATRNAMTGLCTPLAVLLCLFTFAASLFWTVAPQAEGLTSLAKYGKLIMIILLVLLVRDRREARIGLAAFVFAQIFLLASSWLLFAQFPVPWATSRMALGEYSVFSSYLDQGIMSAVFAAICWHLRACLFGKFGHKIAIFLVVAALANVFFVLSGRSGHLVAIALLSIGMMWELPKQYRAIVILLPFLLALGLFFSSAKVQDRLTEVATEVRGYSNQVAQTTSSGIRLQFWQRSLQSIRQHPMAGSGVGSWSHEFNRLEREQNPAHINIDANGNPHQEYLLWGVQLGIPGILLFIALLISVLRDTLKMETPYARATQSTLLALVIACMFNSSIYDAQIGDFFCVLIGLLLALGFTKTAGEATSTPPTSRLCE